MSSKDSTCNKLNRGDFLGESIDETEYLREKILEMHNGEIALTDTATYMITSDDQKCAEDLAKDWFLVKEYQESQLKLRTRILIFTINTPKRRRNKYMLKFHLTD